VGTLQHAEPNCEGRLIPVLPFFTVLSLTRPPAVPTGILLPDSVLASTFFAIFSAFVGINTVIYVVLAVTKILPKIYLTDLVNGRNRRATARSIYGDDSSLQTRRPLATVAVPTLDDPGLRLGGPADGRAHERVAQGTVSARSSGRHSAQSPRRSADHRSHLPQHAAHVPRSSTAPPTEPAPPQRPSPPPTRR
jgi:hypothetical protein